MAPRNLEDALTLLLLLSLLSIRVEFVIASVSISASIAPLGDTPAALDDDDPTAGGVNRDLCCRGVLLYDDEDGEVLLLFVVFVAAPANERLLYDD